MYTHTQIEMVPLRNAHAARYLYKLISRTCHRKGLRVSIKVVLRVTCARLMHAVTLL